MSLKYEPSSEPQVNTRDSLGADLAALHRSPDAFAAAMEVGQGS